MSAPLDAAGDAPPAAHRSPIEGIEAAGVQARTLGHTLAGFVRRCNTTGCGFFARCRTCRIEVGVHRGASGWGHTADLPVCTEPDRYGGARLTSRNGA